MGILLYIIATILWIILTPINWVIVAFKYGISNNYFLETAVDIDKFGNRNFRAFLNATMRINNGYAFTLYTIDKNHCEKSIDSLNESIKKINNE